MPRRGENIYKRKDGRWEGRYVKDRINGKVKYGYVYARTYKEVKDRMDEIADMLSRKGGGTVRGRSKTVFKTVALSWFEALKPQLKKSSAVKYTNILSSHLIPKFGDACIECITEEEISDFSNNLLLSGGRQGTGLSPKTVTDILSVLKSIFEYAAQCKKLSVADIRECSVKQSQKPMRILSLLEQQKLSQYLCEDLNLTNLGILVCLYTGIRVGEVCALKWEDISFDEQCLYVRKTMQRIQNKGSAGQKTSILISDPKSGCSVRRIPLPDEVFQKMLELRCPDSAYFLTGSEHRFIEPRTLQNRFQSVIRACNIEKANFHALRHTFATRCVELGFDVKSLSEILGHASVNITMNRYVHPSMELKQKNMNMLSSLFVRP